MNSIHRCTQRSGVDVLHSADVNITLQHNHIHKHHKSATFQAIEVGGISVTRTLDTTIAGGAERFGLYVSANSMGILNI